MCFKSKGVFPHNLSYWMTTSAPADPFSNIQTIDPVAQWATSNVLTYATTKRIMRGGCEETVTPNILKDKEEFMELFFTGDAPIVGESRSAMTEWLRLLHRQISSVLTETFDFKEITSKQLGSLQKKRKLTNDGRSLNTLLVLCENLKMMMSLTNPAVVMSTFGIDVTGPSPYEDICYDNVTDDIQLMCWEMTSQIIMLLFNIQMPTQPPPQVHGGCLINEDPESTAEDGATEAATETESDEGDEGKFEAV